MKKIALFKQITACALVLLLAVPFAAAQGSEKVFRPEELEQMLAPIALYPDALLAQVLTAATYPLEVVAADRFVKENPGLKGEALLEAAKTRDWEPSVKAMLEFPDVLAMMDEQLEWTKNLGEAFLAQQSDCIDAVQRLRQKAYAQGNLATSGNQVIRVEPQTQTIIIEPASPEIVYVPVYDPAIIYGNWWYPAYPPYYFYPRRYSGISFFTGVFVGAFWGAWDCNWHRRDVDINVDHYNRFTRASYAGGGRYQSYRSGQGNQPWTYDARHRTSAGPRDYSVTQQFSRQQRPSSIVTPMRNIPTGIKELPANVSRVGLARQVNSMPQAKVVSRSYAGNQRSARIPTSGLRAQQAKNPSAVINNVKGRVSNQIVARPASNDSTRNKVAANAWSKEDRAGNRQAADYRLGSGRQSLPSLQGHNELHQGQMNKFGR